MELQAVRRIIMLRRLVIIKYGELTTKKGNISFFLNTLRKNVVEALAAFHPEVTFDRGRMFVIGREEDFSSIVVSLQQVFGIHEITIAYELDTNDFTKIKESLLQEVSKKEFSTFKVFAQRSDKTYPLTSMEIAKKLGGHLLQNIPNICVDVHDPELPIYIELRKEKTYFYFEKVPGAGGYPVGSLGKGILMLSGGIDSPVAGYLAMKRGMKLEAIYFESPPHTSIEAKNKVLALAKKLAVYNHGIKVHVIHFTEIQEAIYKNIPHEYLITIMRRMMYRISAILCHNVRGHVIVNGESIGQVASQTLTSMSVINEVVKMPVIRPVACFDKLEIIDLANKIGTYETSILPYEDCCTIFVPEHPVINPEFTLAREYEERIPYNDLIYEAIKNHEVIKLTAEEEKTFEELL